MFFLPFPQGFVDVERKVKKCKKKWELLRTVLDRCGSSHNLCKPLDCHSTGLALLRNHPTHTSISLPQVMAIVEKHGQQAFVVATSSVH